MKNWIASTCALTAAVALSACSSHNNGSTASAEPSTSTSASAVPSPEFPFDPTYPSYWPESMQAGTLFIGKFAGITDPGKDECTVEITGFGDDYNIAWTLQVVISVGNAVKAVGYADVKTLSRDLIHKVTPAKFYYSDVDRELHFRANIGSGTLDYSKDGFKGITAYLAGQTVTCSSLKKVNQ